MTNQTQLINALDTFRPDGKKIPGVFFIYEFSPFLVEMKEKSVPFSTFLIGLCAIIGGVFTVAGIADSIVHQMNKILKK
jgi:hypothetical protein